MYDEVPVFLILAAPFVGSFLGLVAERLPRGEGVVLGRSRCGHCHHPLALRDLIPLVSWLIARGRCRHCGQAIGPFPLVMELAALAIALWSLLVLPGWLALAGCALGWALLVLAATDLRRFMLPDSITLPLIAAGLAVIALLDPAGLPWHGVAAAVGWVLIWGLGALYRQLRGRAGIGLGDAKLLAAAGAWVGLAGLPSVILLASIGGLGYALLRLRGRPGNPMQRRVPFGAFLALGLWLVWLYGPLTWP